jgi:catechol 2,3-dioxygenase-like lactoylglutathione lyase family enzyme
MIKDVPLTGIFVNDQEAALDFYTNKLGLEKVQDEPYGEGARWITVSPKGSLIRIVLKKAEREHEKAMVGNSDGAPIGVARGIGRGIALVLGEAGATGSFLLGRRTYEIFAAYWPTVTNEKDEIARAPKSLPKYVVSTKLDEAE